MDKTAITELLRKNFALDPQSAKVLVVGLGVTGISAARYLQNLGIKFAIVDSRAKPPLMEEFSEQMPDAAIFTGGFDDAAFKVTMKTPSSRPVSMARESSAILICSPVPLTWRLPTPTAKVPGQPSKGKVSCLTPQSRTDSQ